MHAIVQQKALQSNDVKTIKTLPIIKYIVVCRSVVDVVPDKNPKIASLLHRDPSLLIIIMRYLLDTYVTDKATLDPFRRASVVSNALKTIDNEGFQLINYYI